jgi:hypothetical protein
METFLPIDYAKSLQKQRLVYQTNLTVVFEYIWYCFVLLVTMGPVTMPIIFKPANVSHISIYYIIFCAVFDSWMISNLFYLNAFVKIPGTDHDGLIRVLSEFYKLRNLDIKDFKIRDVRLVGFFHGGRVITVLLNKEIMYLNVTTLLRYDGLSCFNGLYNYYKCKRIAKRFESKFI